MTGSPFKRLRRILAVRLDNIGDLVMLSPALRALRQAAPAASITLMASPAGTQVAPLLPWVDGVITWRAVWQDIDKDTPADPQKELALVAVLEKHHFDAAFIFTSFSQSPYPPAYACYLARIPLRVGQSNEFGGGLLTHWIKPTEIKTYQVERNLHLLREVGIAVENPRTMLLTRPEDRSSVDRLLAERGIAPDKPFLALAPGASATARRYPEARFEQAARQLLEETGLPLILLGSLREIGKFPLLEQLAEEHPQAHNLIGETTVPEMAEVIRRAAVVICNNSGALHIAAALQRPLVVLFSGTEWQQQWVPPDSGIRVLNRETFCTPCFAFQCRYNLECLEISPAEITAAVLDLLESETHQPAQHRQPYAGILEEPNDEQ